MANAHLNHLLQLAGWPAATADNVDITGTDLLLPTPYPFVGPGAACIAATGMAAAELWKL